MTADMDSNCINSIESGNKLESANDQNGVIQPLLTGLYFGCFYFLGEEFNACINGDANNSSLLLSSLCAKCCIMAVSFDRLHTWP